jgi:hypothetical protein
MESLYARGVSIEDIERESVRIEYRERVGLSLHLAALAKGSAGKAPRVLHFRLRNVLTYPCLAPESLVRVGCQTSVIQCRACVNVTVGA